MFGVRLLRSSTVEELQDERDELQDEVGDAEDRAERAEAVVDLIEENPSIYSLDRIDSDKYHGFYETDEHVKAFKACSPVSEHDIAIVELIIPARTRYFSPTFGGKTRCERAYVNNIYGADIGDRPLKPLRTLDEVDMARSSYDHTFKYKPNTLVTPDNGFSEKEKQCSDGIHVFPTVKDIELRYF